jgi:hypothetical protein
LQKQEIADAADMTVSGFAFAQIKPKAAGYRFPYPLSYGKFWFTCPEIGKVYAGRRKDVRGQR